MIASAEQRILWEMGQSEEEQASGLAQTIKLASVAAIAPSASSADGKPAGQRPKPFSPVPMPRRNGDDGARSSPRAKVIERSPARPKPEPSPKAQEPAAAAAPPATPAKPVESKREPKATPEAIDDDAIKELPAPKPKPRVVAGSVIKRAGKHGDPAPEQPQVVTRASKRDARKNARNQRKIDKLLAHMRAADGETVTASLDGTLGFRPATMLITNYRVAIVPHRKRSKCRWIPLEEVTRISCPVGSSNLIVDASVEVLRFGTRRAHKLQAIVGALRAEVKEARTGRGAHRHNAVIVQAWCDRTSEIWDSRLGRIRLWLDHHPRIRLFMFTPLLPLGILIKQYL
jgi:hypothetical protein